MPSFIEIQSEEDEAEIFNQIAQQSGSFTNMQKQKKYKKEKSLGILCQQFIHLFVTWKKVISLEEAAKEISNCEKKQMLASSMSGSLRSMIAQEDQKEQKLKTKVRRLYDIANVL